MKKMICFSKGVAVLALGLVVASCSKMDDVYRQLSEEEAVAHAEEVLDMEIDPNKDWNMTRNGSMTITANAGINTTEVLILDAYPFGNADAKILGQAKANEGETVTIDFIAPKGQEYVYVACRNANNDYRVVYSAIDAGEVSFKQQAPRRAAVASPSVTEVGSTFNSKICQSWNGVLAAEETGTPGLPTFSFMGNYVPWKPSQSNTAWTDKFYQINASVIDSNRPDKELSDIAETIMRVIPEGKYNLDKANETGYSIVTTGGPVTLTPIFHNSNSGDQISYYYYPQGTTPDVKSLKKYVVGNMADPETANTNNYSFNKRVYSLVYEDANGNVSYDFPEGYVINFIITNTWVGNGTVEIYESGGETISNNNSSETGGFEPGDQIFKYALSENKTFFCGEYAVGGPYDSYFVRMGNGGQADWSNARNENYDDFIAAKSDSNAPEGYSAFTEGNGKNGNLSELGTTVYYLKYVYNNNDGLDRGDDEFMARVGIVINASKPLYVVELNDKNDTQGTPVEGFNGKTYAEKTKEVIEFRIKQGKTYAIYATGSKLGFYGCEVLYENSKRNNNNNTESSTATITDVVKTSIPNNPEYYGDGAYNTAIHTSGIWQWNLDASLAATPHAAVFSINGKNYVGFEDWKDLDFNDVIFEITGTEGGEEIPVEELGKPIYSYAFEDTNGGDYDMNDVVIRARESEDGTKMILKFVAAGATLDLNVRLYPNAGSDGMTYGETFKVLDRNGKTEIHEMFNADHGYMINTNGGDANCASATPFEIEIDKATYGITDASKLRLAIYAPQHKVEMRLSGAGTMPYGLIVPGNWKWPQEYINIKRAYSNKNTNEAEADQSFENYGSRHDDNQEHAVWWFMYPTDNLVMDESNLPQ